MYIYIVDFTEKLCLELFLLPFFSSVNINHSVMKLELAVIVSDVSHENNFESFAHTLGLIVEKKDGQVPFRDAAFNWKKGFVDVMFSSKGTLVCVPFGEYNVAAASRESQVALLSVSDNSGSINIECAENGSMKRIYTVLKGDVRRNVKEPLSWEKKSSSYSDMLSDCLKELTGKKLLDYKNDTATRYAIR